MLCAHAACAASARTTTAATRRQRMRRLMLLPNGAAARALQRTILDQRCEGNGAAEKTASERVPTNHAFRQAGNGGQRLATVCRAPESRCSTRAYQRFPNNTIATTS